MKAKRFYLISLAAIANVTLSSCVDQGNNIGNVDNNSSPSLNSGLATSRCGTLAKPKRIELDKISELPKGEILGLSATLECSNGKRFDITADTATNWASSNYKVLDVDNKDHKGKVTGVANGVSNLKVTYGGLVAQNSVSVVDSICGTSRATIKVDNVPEIIKGDIKHLTAFLECGDGNRLNITNDSATDWDSSENKVLQVDNSIHKGQIKGNSLGSAVLTVNYKGVYTNQNIDVVHQYCGKEHPILEVRDVLPFPIGASRQLSAYVKCGSKEFDITHDSLTSWSSSNTKILDVDSNGFKGLATGIALGTAYVKVTHDGLSKAMPVSIVNSYCGVNTQMVGAHVEPANYNSIPVGGQQELHLIADCNNGTTADITQYGSWQSSSKLILNVNNTDHKGLTEGVKKGRAIISVSLDTDEVYERAINVDGAVLENLVVNGDAIVSRGLTTQLNITGIYADSSEVNVTKIAKYTVVYGNVSVGTNGVVKAIGEGAYKIQVSLDGKTASFEGLVTSARLIGFSLNNPNMILTPYLNTTVALTATANYSDGSKQAIPNSQLRCEIEHAQTDIIQNTTDGCSFSQIGEVENNTNVKVSYINDLTLPEQRANIKISLSPIKGVSLISDNPNKFIVGDEKPYEVKVLLANGDKIDVTSSMKLTLMANNVKQDFTPMVPILFDSKNKVIIFNKEITSMTPYKLIAKIGDLESSITYSNVHTNELSVHDLNTLLVNTFRDKIKEDLLNRDPDMQAYIVKDGIAHPDNELKHFFRYVASEQIQINNLSSEDIGKASSIYNKAIDYDTNDPNYKVTVQLERNPDNRSNQVILSEFCNNTPVTQSFSTASISTSQTDGYSWGLGEKLGLDIAAKGGANLFGFKGEVTQTTKFEFSSSQTWNKQDTYTYSLGGATVTLPPRQHAIVVSMLHNTDYYYHGKLPLKLNGGYPVVFRVYDPVSNISGVVAVNLAKIYIKGRNEFLDHFFEVNDNKLYLDLEPQLSSSGGKDIKTATHSVYFVNDNDTGVLPCIYPNSNGNLHDSTKQYNSGDLPMLSKQTKFEFLNSKPDFILNSN